MPGPTRATCDLVDQRAGYRCEKCLGSAQGGSRHHRRPRGMGGDRRPETNAASNIVLLCGSGTTGCHGWVESHRPEATDLGFLVRKSSRLLPAEVPIHGLARFPEPVWLTDAGTYSDTPPEGETA